MEKMFPIFVNLRGRRAVVVGGGEIALRRARALLRFGAEVTVVAPELRGAAEGAKHLARRYRWGDLRGAALAVAATDVREVNRAVGREAGRRHIPVSVADCREECTFFFPALCEGGGVVAGLVSCEGTEHAQTASVARAVRALLAELEEGQA